MDSKEVNVIVRNLGVQSRPNGKKNPIWSVLTSVISSLYALELENIKERTSVGRQIYVQRGGILGRKIGSTTSDRDFIDKPKSQKILEYIKKEWTIREIAKQVDASTKTVLKVKKVANKLNLV
jgi:DNA invertase Pin-like site-specific DNA recombinase